MVKSKLDEAKITFKKIDAIAATAGPGLLGGLLVGVVAGKTLAHYLNKPFIAVNHLEGHALSIKLEKRYRIIHIYYYWFQVVILNSQSLKTLILINELEQQ